MELLVVGAGEIGRWVARSVGADVALADRDPDVAEAGADELARDVAVDGETRAVALDTDETFDGVCLAVPISAVADAVATHADRAERAMLDVAGVMAEPVAAMAEHCPGLERLSLHPLFAPVRAPGTVAAVVEQTGPVTDAIREDLAAAGNDVVETTPAEHDSAMETVQAGAHAAVLAYALATEDVHDAFQTPVSTGLESLVETVTEGSPGVYAEIQTAFDGADDVADAARRLADADEAEFASLYEAARERAGTGAREGASAGAVDTDVSSTASDARTAPDADEEEPNGGE